MPCTLLSKYVDAFVTRIQIHLKELLNLPFLPYVFFKSMALESITILEQRTGKILFVEEGSLQKTPEVLEDTVLLRTPASPSPGATCSVQSLHTAAAHRAALA